MPPTALRWAAVWVGLCRPGRSGSPWGLKPVDSDDSGMKKRAQVSVGPKGSAPPPAQDSESAGSVHYWSGAHTRHRMLVHLVMCPKYRRRVLEAEIKDRLLALFGQLSQTNSWYIHEINVQPDHLHLLIQWSPSERVSDLVKGLKGASSRAIRLEFPGLEEFLWGSSFWSEGYFAESVGHRDEAAVSYYIRHQRASPPGVFGSAEGSGV